MPMVAAVAETVMGLALLLVPSIVAQVLIEEELVGAAVTVARAGGMALVGLGSACRPAVGRPRAC